MRRRAAWMGSALLTLLTVALLTSTLPAAPVHAAPAAGADPTPSQAVNGARTPAEAIGVLYPDIAEPLRKVFLDIVEGIDERAHARVRAYPVGAGQDMAELAATLKRNGTRVLIALGRQGLKAAGGLDAPAGLVIGGISSLPDADKHLGIVLTPDPTLLFTQIKTLLPSTRRVLVVYNPRNNEWLIRLAREAARSQGLELVTYEAGDLAGAARQYEAAFGAADRRRDALWLPTDATTVDESTILPLVLREAWDRSVPVFSSSFLHIKKGALFALYPNNLDLGRALGALALGLASGETARRGVTPLREVHLALNTRTASHLGIDVGPVMAQHNVNYVYPEP